MVYFYKISILMSKTENGEITLIHFRQAHFQEKLPLV